VEHSQNENAMEGKHTKFTSGDGK